MANWSKARNEPVLVVDPEGAQIRSRFTGTRTIHDVILLLLLRPEGEIGVDERLCALALET